MAENPLLPHRRLQELYALIQRCRKLDGRSGAIGGREAVLAGTSIHLEPGDIFAAPASDPAAVLSPESPSEQVFADGFFPNLPRLLTLAAIARGLLISGSGRIALALTGTHVSEPSWTEALTWAQTDRLPLVFCVTEMSGAGATRRRGKQSLAWPAVNSVCEELTLPTLSVDGEDAVAVFRVMQEAALRARTGSGPSLIWAFGSSGPLAPNGGPTARLRRYMTAREIPLQP